MSSTVSKTEIKCEEVCRTCLSKETELQSLFDLLPGCETLDFVVNAITGVKIERGDGLPSMICCDCREKAEKAYEFKQKSQEVDNKLRGLFKKEKKEFSHIEVPLYQATNVKTEQLNDDDNNEDNVDYLDADFIPNEQDDSLDAEVITKRETRSESKRHFVALPSAAESKETKRSKCIKVEPEDSVSTYCPLCGTSYDGAENLTNHMWTFHADLMGPKKRGRPKKLITSTILNKLSENGFCLKSVQPVKLFGCVFCTLQCKSTEELEIHMTKHKDTKVHCCLFCKKMYLKKKHFDQHGCVVKPDEDDAQQKNCWTEIMLQEIFDPANDVVNMNILQICNLCSGLFLSAEDLSDHNDVEHPERSLRCNICAKAFSSVKSASRHRSMCKQVDRKHVCSTCGLKFAYEISLNKHILRHHEGQSVSVSFMSSKQEKPEDMEQAPVETQELPQFQCDTCKRCFPKKESLAKHTKTHMPLEKYFECDICKKKFNRKDNLRSHKKIHEPNREKPPNNCLCLYCGRGFTNSSNLIVHMRRHTGEKPYKCDFCGKGFPRSSDLQCHRRSHTGEKPCVCRICGKAFSRSNKLSRHMRVHTGQKPYKCTYCEKAFSQSNDLTLHIRRHTGDKPYICEICGDRFIQGTALQNHRRVHGHFPPSSSEPPPSSLVLAYPGQAPMPPRPDPSTNTHSH